VTRLVVVRHGRTGWNVAGRIQGHLDSALDEVGEAQARALGPRIAALAPAALVASDLRRAADTAAAIAAATGLPVRSDTRLRERAFGQWQGLLDTEVAERFPEAYGRWKAGQPVDEYGVEPIDDLAKRTAAAFQDAADLAPDATVVVVGHGASIRHGLGMLLGWPEPVLRTIRVLGSCHQAVLRRDAVRGWRLDGYNLP
jgi:glucosyl-3-phosphoglycerate phosphatase